MSRINLLTVGVNGVDMKSNPLFISASKKLASATNMQFTEGALKQRPGIRYESLNVRGQFQGEEVFRPARGISSSSFSDDRLLHVLVVDGVIRVGCMYVSGPIFKGAGAVHIFQAENYLVFQNGSSFTYWWDGRTLTQSPGLNEQDWNDPDMPRTELDVVAPVADIPDCMLDGDSNFLLKFTVINDVSEEVLSGVRIALTKRSTTAYKGFTDATGVWKIRPVVRTYYYTASKAGYATKDHILLELVGNTESTVFDPCFAPYERVVGGANVIVRLSPNSPPATSPVPGP